MPLDLRFDERIPENQQQNIVNTYEFARSRIALCAYLSKEERDALSELFEKSSIGSGYVVVFNTITDDPDVNAKVSVKQIVRNVYEATVEINFNNLKFDDTPVDEERQTIIHEMMHVVGYDHPVRCDEINDRCNAKDVPLDGGPYYASPPLRAERCIAGNQSIVENQSLDKFPCSLWQGKWVTWKSQKARAEVISKEFYESRIGLNRLLKLEDIL